MPIVSKAQARWAHANEDKPGPEGKAAAEFVDASHGIKLSSLPERVSRKARGGAVKSPKPFRW